MSAPLAPAAVHACPNCGADAPHEYCARCGQSQRDRLRVSVRELAGEGIEQLTDLDGTFVVTLRHLFLRPGLLTAEYIAGRRARYVRPLRLYLTASVVFFLAFAFGSREVETRAGEPTTVLGIRIGAPDTTERPDPPPGAGLTVGGDAEGTRLERLLEGRAARFSALSQAEQVRLVVDALKRHVPKAFFVLVPLSALLLHTLYWRRGMRYAEHLIFALHVHAFGFFVTAPAVLFPSGSGGIEDAIAGLWLIGYAFVAMRHTYGGSPLATAGRILVLGSVYMTGVVLALLAVVFVAVML